jgi:hypothetical protein
MTIPDLSGMNVSLTQWLDSCARAPGILACGVCRPDRTCVSASISAACPRELMDQILKTLADSLPAFSTRGFLPDQLKWTFERGQLLLVARPDGCLLGLVMQPDSPSAQNPDVLTGEFLALELAEVEPPAF